MGVITGGEKEVTTGWELVPEIIRSLPGFTSPPDREHTTEAFLWFAIYKIAGEGRGVGNIR